MIINPSPIRKLILAAAVAWMIVPPEAQAARPSLSPESQMRFAALKSVAPGDSIWRQARERALAAVINPDDYTCGPTDFDVWIGGKFGAIHNFDAFLDIVINLGALDWATFYTLAFDQNAADDYIGVAGGQTTELVKRHKDNQRFWDIPSQDILLQGMHGANLADDAKMIPVVQLLFGVPSALAAEIVDYVQSVIQADPGLGFNNPLFTLNAFAVTTQGEPPESPFFGIPNKIVMGDGILEALVGVGLGNSAPDFVHAHEFAHHVQFKRGLFDAPVPESELPEFTRRTELMADAFGSYFCAHARGAAMQAKRIIEAFRGAYVLGDCAFDFPGHHGTPNQRAAAAEWGIKLASGSRGKINSSAAMIQLFEAQLPILIAPDSH